MVKLLPKTEIANGVTTGRIPHLLKYEYAHVGGIKACTRENYVSHAQEKIEKGRRTLSAATALGRLRHSLLQYYILAVDYIPAVGYILAFDYIPAVDYNY